MNYAERIRDLTDKFMQEMENLKTKNTVVTGEKEKEASKHAEQVHDLVEKQNKELQDLGKDRPFPRKPFSECFSLEKKKNFFYSVSSLAAILPFFFLL